MSDFQKIEILASLEPKKPSTGVNLEPLIYWLRFNIGGHENALRDSNLPYGDRMRMTLRLTVMITLLGLLGGCVDFAVRGDESLVSQWYHGDLLPD